METALLSVVIRPVNEQFVISKSWTALELPSSPYSVAEYISAEDTCLLGPCISGSFFLTIAASENNLVPNMIG